MMPEELLVQAQERGMRLCLDLAHLMMTCNYFGLDFQGSLKQLMPITAHLHLADASGTNGEGVEMGAGDINWLPAWKTIRSVPNVSFITEVWQGHKDKGSGFWVALNLLNEIDIKVKNNNTNFKQ